MINDNIGECIMVETADIKKAVNDDTIHTACSLWDNVERDIIPEIHDERSSWIDTAMCASQSNDGKLCRKRRCNESFVRPCTFVGRDTTIE